MSRFLAKKYRTLDAYVPGEQPRDKRYIKLNTNEFPYPPAPDVIAAVDANVISDLRLYSDPTAKNLKESLAKYYGVGAENVFVSNGSDESLNFAFACFFEDGVAFADLTYGFYSVFADLYGIDAKIIPLDSDFSIVPEDYMGLDRGAVIANPNAPTGKALPLADIERIVASNPDRVIVVDEAYVDFGGESAIPLTKKYDNLLVCMTYSKSRGMAGARLGFAIGNTELIADLELMKYSTNPYNLDSLALKMGAAALTDSSKAYYEEKVGEVIKVREDTAEKLKSLGAEVLPSKANFLFVKLPNISGGEAYGKLRERGILVRHFSKARISDHLRISIGTAEDMSALVEAVAQIIKE
ncbi:MAG: histidinol-phosphate transaminase [Clostridia bacterium]|nr:histidinol-phosphate transaminase [Clostridia bacterium]